LAVNTFFLFLRQPGCPEGRRALRYKLRSVAALDIALGHLPNRMRVEVDPGIAVSARTVGELRKVTVWPENLAITTPHANQSKNVVKVSKANVATRVSPKQ
jgi:hypothetical protein